MSKLSTLLVAVRKISSSEPRSNFSEQQIESLAQLILEVEGLINPLVLRRTSLESFDVVSGHLEYYAAVRAREINLRKGEMINAFLLETENEVTLEKQIELLRNSTPAIINNSDTRIDNLETRVENRFQELQQQQQNYQKEMEKRVKEIENKLPEKIEPLTAFNEWDLPKLSDKLKKTGGCSGNVVEAIIKNRPYNNLREVVDKPKIKHGKKLQRAIGETKMLAILYNWF